MARGDTCHGVAVRLTEKSTYIRYANTGKVLKFTGRGLIVLGFGLDVYNMVNNNYSKESIVRLGIGATITGIGFVPVVGLPISIVLGTIEIGGGFDGLYDAAAGR